MENITENLADKLKEYAINGDYPFHMPGHKRAPLDSFLNNAYRMDITEISGFDDLHHAEGVIQSEQNVCAQLYHSESAHFLINGSTCGILAAISAVSSRATLKDTLLMCSNAHKSVYHAVQICRLKTMFLDPEETSIPSLYAQIEPKQVQRILEQSFDKIVGVVITSPTYEGVLSNVEEIAKICHLYKIPLIVDSAHGAHLGISTCFPKSAIEQGADIVITSLHKTTLSLTQTALLLTNYGLDEGLMEYLQYYLTVYQSSSPSYILLYSISRCVELLRLSGEQRLNELRMALSNFYAKVSLLKKLKVLTKEDFDTTFDDSKIIISTKHANIKSQELFDRLREEYHLVLELVSIEHVVAIVTMMDSGKALDGLANALITIDSELDYTLDQGNLSSYNRKREFAKTIFEALNDEREEVLLKHALGRVSAQYLYLYPPGIPLVIPGEVIHSDLLEIVNCYQINGLSVLGPASKESNYIKVLCETKLT